MDEAFEQLVTPVYRFALRLATGDVHLAEDLTQETIVRGLQAFQSDTRRPSLDDRDAVRTWLFTVAANVWRDHLRRDRVRTTHRDAAARTKPTHAPSPDRALMLDETTHRAMDLLDQLPERQAQVLYLSACEGLDLPRIAVVLGITRRAATASLSLARRRMSELMAASAEAGGRA